MEATALIPLIGVAVGFALGYMVGRFSRLPKQSAPTPKRDARGRFIKEK